MVVSPFAKAHDVDGSFRDYTAILHFIEHVYGLPAIAPDSLEQQTDDLFSMFAVGAPGPQKFRPIQVSRPPAYWAALPSPAPSCIPATPIPEPPGSKPALAAEPIDH